jgi:hypothetical protein
MSNLGRASRELMDDQIFELPNLENAVYASDGLAFVLPTLTEDTVPRRNTTKESLTEIIVADIGDETSKSPYLIVSLSFPSDFSFANSPGPNEIRRSRDVRAVPLSSG